MSYNYKYGDNIKDISDCPPQECTNKNIEGFRFVFEKGSAEEKNNFLPPLVKNPSRKGFDEDSTRCSGYALSFYDSQDKAKNIYLAVRKRRKAFNLGTHLAKVNIEENDGVVTKINHNGHFDLHEYEHTDLSKKCEIISILEN